MLPVLNTNAPFVVTILYDGSVAHQTCKGFKLCVRPNSSLAERYHLEWVDLTRNQKEAFVASTYTRSLDGRTYTIVNELQFNFIFESKMFET